VPAGIFLLASAFLDLLAGQGIQGEANRNLRHSEFSSAAASFAQSAAILRKNPQGGSILWHLGRFNEQLTRLFDVLVYGRDADGQKPN
jgi:hypothetical protein